MDAENALTRLPSGNRPPHNLSQPIVSAIPPRVSTACSICSDQKAAFRRKQLLYLSLKLNIVPVATLMPFRRAASLISKLSPFIAQSWRIHFEIFPVYRIERKGGGTHD